jgi:4-amino-4-deoxy-L-arabinose transferase-like glycosyltransferase
MDKLTSKQFSFALTIVGLVFFIPFLGGVHLFDWDEINFAESAREMLVTGNFRQVLVNYEPFWEKPPMFFWLQALSMKVFGVNEFTARLPNALIGVVSLHTLYYFGKKLLNELTARWWVLLYLASITPHFYFHTGIIDPLFNLLIFTSLIQLFLTLNDRSSKRWIYAGLLLGLAVITKGPVAGLIVLLTLGVIWVRNSFGLWFKWSHAFLFSLITLLVTSIWFLPEVLYNGPGFIVNFVSYQLDLLRSPVASHGQPWYYHPIVLLIGCFPASVLAIKRFAKANDANDFESLLKYLFWVVLILFSIVTTKIVHYSSLCYFSLTGLAAIRMSAWVKGEAFGTLEKIRLSVLTLIWAVIFVALPVVGFRLPDLLQAYPDLIKDSFTLQNLSVVNSWSIWNIVLGLMAMIVLVGMLIGLIRNNRLLATYSMFGLSSYLVLFLAFTVPKIERYTQGSVIDFYESIQDKDCYVDVYKFKSYAHYFYTNIEPLNADDGLLHERINKLISLGVSSRIELNEEQRKEYTNYEMQWMLSGDIDKPVYLIAQPRKAQELADTEGFEFIQNTGGYWVYKRMPRED